MGDAPSQASRSFVPAAGHDWLLPLYDPVQWLLGGDAVRRTVVEAAGLSAGQRVLDIGCGTGSLVVLVKQLHPDVEVTGLDPDPLALGRARRKSERAGVALDLREGFSDALPWGDDCFHCVFSSFMFHHLESQTKRETLREVRRVLVPGGSLHLVDFGGPTERPDGLLARLLHASDHLKDNFGNRMPALMAEAGFADARERGQRRTLFGRVAHYQALKPRVEPPGASSAGA